MLKKLDSWFFALKWPLPLFIIIGFMAWFSLYTYKKRYLSIDGAVMAFISGVIVLWCTHIQGFIVLVYFFISSNILSKYCRKKSSSDIKDIEQKVGTRDGMQVFANGLMAVVASLYYYSTVSAVSAGKIGALVMFGAAIAEATSDTWAGEIGRLSSVPPVSIRTFKVVPKGLSGGVTPLGFIAAFVGSFTVALLWLILFRVRFGFLSLTIIMLSGFAGCVLDSYLGATFQIMYLDQEKNELTEISVDKDGKPRKQIRGISWLDNDMVNLVSNMFSALLALLLSNFL